MAELLTRYFAAVDDKRIDANVVRETFTSDARIIPPGGTEMTGRESILDSHTKSFARFRATHHVITNFIIDIKGNRASLRSNIIANHMWADNEEFPSPKNKYFLADGVFSAKTAKAGNQWHISELKNNVVWPTRDGMNETLAFSERSKDK